VSERTKAGKERAKGGNGWERVTRWAGIGNNGKDAQNAVEGTDMGDTMVDEKQELNEGTEFAATAERVDAGTEANGEETADAAQAEITQLKGERDLLVDRLARLQAEFDNARKREAKERADAREYTVGSTVEPFLGVMDNFQLALKSGGNADQLRSGVELILKQMEDALKGLQVTPVESVGTQFDPRIHEALGSIETVEFPDHQVLEEIRRGYRIREKLLRPAMVKIAENKKVVSD
jgi:molecular chaperone GrpE